MCNQNMHTVLINCQIVAFEVWTAAYLKQFSNALHARSTFLLSIHTYTMSNKNPSAWNFVSLEPEVKCGTVAIIIRVVLLSPYLRIRGVSLSSIHHNHTAYILTEDNNTFA